MLAVPNSVNNGVFVAGILKRNVWDTTDFVSLIGHDGVIDVTVRLCCSHATLNDRAERLCRLLTLFHTSKTQDSRMDQATSSLFLQSRLETVSPSGSRVKIGLL